MEQEDIWVLTDHRTGNSNQAIALAESLPYDFQVKFLEYNLLARLPNFLIRGTNCFLRENVAKNITTPYPKLVISTGRRCAALALYIKNQNPETKIIQLMRPDAPPHLFDLIVLPQHDRFNNPTSNICYIIGALNNIRTKHTPVTQQKFADQYPNLDNNFITILIGGTTKKDDFTQAESERLAQQMLDICDYHALPAFISFSRRTTSHLKDAFIKHFTAPHIIFDPASTSNYNPYLGMLFNARYIICPGDSVSMCSEAVATGKPVYIFTPQTFSSKKHRYFIQQLVDLGLAKRLHSNVDHLVPYKYHPLEETQQITQRIIRLLEDEH